jgi:predicted pyridoxine 5'-phosphate oxidase superfamily flavin-nucleotide-binding protein
MKIVSTNGDKFAMSDLKPDKRQEVVTLIPEKLQEVLKHDGVVAIATLGQDGPHMVNTWNSYVQITSDGRLLIPAGYMQLTEANIAFNSNVLLTLGSSKVAGRLGPGTGFLIKGSAAFISSGPDFDAIKAKFAWARAVLAVTIASVTQTL